MKTPAFFLLFLSCISLCAQTTLSLPTRGDTHLSLFDKEDIRFDPKTYGNYQEDPTTGTIRLGNGRIVLRAITLPDYQRDVQISLKIRLVSKGDTWDKSGSCFVLPSTPINLLSIAKGEAQFPKVDSTRLEQLIGVVPDKDYWPTVELMRFMTPFGVGHFSNNEGERATLYRPVYVPRWEDAVVWQQDITELFPMLAGEKVYIGVFIDTWTAEGFSINASLDIRESKYVCAPLPHRRVLPLLNTVYYLGQAFPDIFARKNLSVDFDLPAHAKNVCLRYIVTGHGGHSGGDEFTPQKNILSIDGQEVLNFVPWRDDCASFRRFNPTSGVWLQKRLTAHLGETGYTSKEIEEPIASSDLSRSNWCPGSDVLPVEVSLDHLTPGKHTFTLSIPKAQAIEGDALNHWLVSACLVWEE